MRALALEHLNGMEPCLMALVTPVTSCFTTSKQLLCKGPIGSFQMTSRQGGRLGRAKKNAPARQKQTKKKLGV